MSVKQLNAEIDELYAEHPYIPTNLLEAFAFKVLADSNPVFVQQRLMPELKRFVIEYSEQYAADQKAHAVKAAREVC